MPPFPTGPPFPDGERGVAAWRQPAGWQKSKAPRAAADECVVSRRARRRRSCKPQDPHPHGVSPAPRRQQERQGPVDVHPDRGRLCACVHCCACTRSASEAAGRAYCTRAVTRWRVAESFSHDEAAPRSPDRVSNDLFARTRSTGSTPLSPVRVRALLSDDERDLCSRPDARASVCVRLAMTAWPMHQYLAFDPARQRACSLPTGGSARHRQEGACQGTWRGPFTCRSCSIHTRTHTRTHTHTHTHNRTHTHTHTHTHIHTHARA